MSKGESSSTPPANSHQMGSRRPFSQALFPQDKCVNEVGMRTVRLEESGASGGVDLRIAGRLGGSVIG